MHAFANNNSNACTKYQLMIQSPVDLNADTRIQCPHCLYIVSYISCHVLQTDNARKPLIYIYSKTIIVNRFNELNVLSQNLMRYFFSVNFMDTGFQEQFIFSAA